MGETLSQIIPLSLAAAIDPVLLTLTLTLLAGKNYPKGRAISFFLGSAIVMALVAYLGILLGEGVIGGKDRHIAKAVIDIIFAFLLFFLGINSLLEKKREKKEEKKLEEVEKEIPSRGWLKWLIVGFIVNITNVDAVILYLTATKEIGHAQLSSPDMITLAVISGAIVLLPILLPLILTIIIAKTAAKVLSPIGKFMEKYGAYIVGAIFIGFGVMMMVRGIKIFI